MLDKLHTILYTDCHLSPKSVIVVGVSGGPDSLCLLHILLAAGFQVVPAHYNHNLRPQSAEDARFVERFTTRYGLSCKIGSGNVAAFSRQSGCSIEEAGRILRYRFLFEQAALVGAKAVAVGHQADDQVETVLLHILRGSGLTGLNGMAYWQLPNPWSQEVPLVRPLLSVWREEILAYCDQHHLSPVEDASNQDVGFVRNRLRHELIPALETFNPRIRQAVWRMSRSIQADVQVLDELTQAAWSECLSQSGDGAVSLWHDRMLRQPVALQRRLLRRAISELRQVSRSLSTGTQDVDFEMIELGLSAMRQVPKTRQIDLGLGLRLIFEPNLVWVAAWESHLPKGDWPSVSPGSAALPLSVPGCLPLGDSWQLTTRRVSAADSWPQFQAHMDPYQAWLDISNFSDALVVRVRLPGDRFHPLGLEGHSIKLSDFMINMKLPARARSHWPLVCAGEKIVWVPGYAVSHLARLQPGSHVVVQLKLERTA